MKGINEQIDDLVADKLREGLGSAFRVSGYEGELSSPEMFDDFLSRVDTYPNLLVSSSPVDSGPANSRARNGKDAFQLEVLIAVTDHKNFKRHKDFATKICFYVKKILMGGEVYLETPDGEPLSSRGLIEGGDIDQMIEEEFFSVFAVTFDLELIIDLDQIVLPTETT